MGAATLTKNWTIADNGGWAETFNFNLQSTPGGPVSSDDITGCSGQVSVIRPGRPAASAYVFNSTDATPYVTIVDSPASLTLSIPPTSEGTLDWEAGIYDVQVRVIPASGGPDRYNLIGLGRLTVVEAPGT